MNINQPNTHGYGASSQSTAPAPLIKKTPLIAEMQIPASTELKIIGKPTESKEQVRQAAQKIQNTVDNLAQNLRFSIDEDTGKTIIKVVDAHTDELIRQIPSEEAVEIARTLDKVQGLLFNGKA